MAEVNLGKDRVRDTYSTLCVGFAHEIHGWLSCNIQG